MAEAAVMKKKYTYEDYLKTPDDVRYELIEGELLMTPSPNTEHQSISMELGYQMVKFVKDNNLGRIFYAPYDVYLDQENVLEPDILFVSKERLSIIGEKNIQGAPDLVVEIVSESNAYRDVIQKKRLYARFGVKEYWLVIPGEKMIEVYNLDKQGYRLSQTCLVGDTLESQVLKGFKPELREIF